MQIFFDAHILQDLPAFRYEGYAFMDDLIGFRTRKGRPFKADFPFPGRHQPHNGFHGRRFPGAIGTDEGNDTAFPYGQADTLEGHDAAVSGYDIF